MYIAIENLNKTIKGTPILKNISLTFQSGKVYGLKGKNGSGKTMLMRAVSGLIRPTNGTIDINGDILGKNISFPKSIGVLIENPSFINKYTGFKNLKILADIQNKIDDEKIIQTMNDVGLDPFDKRCYRKYSLGMKQRLGIACAIMEEPDIVLLDEPINALDDSGVLLVRNILANIKKRGGIVIIACHDKEELELLSDEIYELNNGEIVGHNVLLKDEEEI